MTTIATPPDDTPALDEERVAAFADQLFGFYTGGFVTFMIDLGVRTGLLDAIAQGAVTSDDLAARAGLQERYVREWLGAVVTAGIVDYDPATAAYTLPAEHTVCLTGDTEFNIAPLSLLAGLLAKHIQPVATAFREGGGVPYTAYRPEFTDVMDGLARGTFDGALVGGVVALVSGLADRLQRGIDVADIGCGTGHSTNLLAHRVPGVQVRRLRPRHRRHRPRLHRGKRRGAAQRRLRSARRHQAACRPAAGRGVRVRRHT